MATWQAVHAALAPVLGARGVGALYKRVVFLAGQSHPWLLCVAESAAVPGDFGLLRNVLGRRDSREAAAVQQEMLQALRDLLDQLIGPALTGRLLHDVWASHSAGKSARDVST